MPLIRFTTDGLARRCRSRGVTVDAVEPAVVSRDGDAIALDDQHDAYQPIRIDAPRIALPSGKSTKPTNPCRDDSGLSVEEARRRLRGLGDITADSLASVGITKERVTYWLGRDCGCDARQEWLNNVGLVFGIGRAKYDR